MNTPLRLAIHGLGKVGELVRAEAESDPDIQLVAVIDRSHPGATFSDIGQAELADCDGLIDFSAGAAVTDLLTAARSFPRLRIVTGSSGWLGALPEIKETVERQGGYFLYGANFSVGTAFFMEIARYAAALFGQLDGYDAALLDIHHRGKPDMPSGTALALAQKLTDAMPAKTEPLIGLADRAVQTDELHVAALRLGANKGFHQVWFDAAEETVTLSQQTHDRSVYAKGSLLALKWLMAQTTPGYYTFDHVLESYYQKAGRSQ